MSSTDAVRRFEKLKAGNYHEWEINMSAALRSRGLWAIVTGKRTKPVVPSPTATNADAVSAAQEKVETWEDEAEKAAGDIMLNLSQDEQKAVRASADDPVALWKALKDRHVQTDKVNARFNALDDFFSIRLEEGETLAHLATRVKDAMGLVQERRPDAFDLKKLDEELQIMAIIRAMSGSDSCRSLVTSLMHSADLGKLEALESSLLTEDIQRKKNPQLYGLETTPEGVLLAKGTLEARANAAQAASGKGRRSGGSRGNSGASAGSSGSSGAAPGSAPASDKAGTDPCAWCKSHGRSGKGHTTQACYQRRIAELESKDRSGNAGNAASTGSNSGSAASFAAAGEFAGAATAASALPASPSLLDVADDAWNADTGATSHMTPHRHFFASYTPFRTPVRLADGNVIYSEGVGSVVFEPVIEGVEQRPIELTRVLHVPLLRANLLSVLYLSLHKRFTILIHDETLLFAQDNAVLFTARINNGCAAFLEGRTRVTPSAFAAIGSALRATVPQDLSLWHRRTMHHNLAGIQRVLRDDLATGLSLDATTKPDPVCEPCLAGKMHARSFPSTGTITTSVLELVHADLVEMPVRTAQGYRYFVGFHDDASSFHAVYLLRRKSDAFDSFMEYKAWAERTTGKRIISLQEDKGGEFVGKRWDAMYASTGIRPRETTRKRPEQNGVAERANRTVVEGTCAVLAESGLPHSFWGEALLSFVDVWNRLPSNSTRGRSLKATPYELWYGKKPDFSHLRVWGCRAYAHVQRDKRDKLQWHIIKGVFIGYPEGYKGWRIWDGKRVVICETVLFDERYFPHSKLAPSEPMHVQFERPSDALEAPDFAELPDQGEDGDTPSSRSRKTARHDPAPAEQGAAPQAPLHGTDNSRAGSPAQDPPPPQPSPSPSPPPPARPAAAPRSRGRPKGSKNSRAASLEPTRPRSTRKVIPHPPDGWMQPASSVLRPAVQIEEVEDDDAPAPASSEEDDGAEGGEEPILGGTPRSDSPEEWEDDETEEVREAVCFSFDGKGEYAFFTPQSDPVSFRDALSRADAAEWTDAALAELLAHLRNGTWTVVELPPGKVAIGSRWVFKLKRNPDGTIDRYKARLVAQGFSQRPGFDYFEVFAGTPRFEAIRAVLALAACEDMHLRFIDVSNAFLNGEIDAEVYMRQPEGFERGGRNTVLRLNKAIYGLKQASRQWKQKLVQILVDELGFKEIYSDASLYVFQKDGVRIIMPVYVDDGMMASTSKSLLDWCVVELSKRVKMRDLGESSFLLGMLIERDRSVRMLALSQRQYILDMLTRYRMDQCDSVKTPMNKNAARLSKLDGPQNDAERQEMQLVPYGEAVGSLLYLARGTRPDIAYTVAFLARFVANPGRAHWQAVKHLFRYLQGTKDLRLVYRGERYDPEQIFRAFTDSAHGDSVDTGRSTSGYLLTIGGGAVSWSSRLQSLVAQSTTEAEYIAAVDAGREAVWMRNLLTELGYTLSGPTVLHMDNQSSISVAKNPEHHGRMKHLDLRFFWLRDQVKAKLLVPAYVGTENMPADILTKALDVDRVERCRASLGLE